LQDCAGKIPSKRVYEDDEILAFNDVDPVAPVHFMMIPKQHIATLGDVQADDRDVPGNMLVFAGRLAEEQGSTDGFLTIVKTGRVGRQDIYHLHMHIIGGKDPLPGMIQKSK
jgi:histidine triad (HIT) family protein